MINTNLDSSSTLIIELAESNLSLNISLFCQKLIVFDEVVVEDAARVASVLDLVLKSGVKSILIGKGVGLVVSISAMTDLSLNPNAIEKIIWGIINKRNKLEEEDLPFSQ